MPTVMKTYCDVCKSEISNDCSGEKAYGLGEPFMDRGKNF